MLVGAVSVVVLFAVAPLFLIPAYRRDFQQLLTFVQRMRKPKAKPAGGKPGDKPAKK